MIEVLPCSVPGCNVGLKFNKYDHAIKNGRTLRLTGWKLYGFDDQDEVYLVCGRYHGSRESRDFFFTVLNTSDIVMPMFVNSGGEIDHDGYEWGLLCVDNK